MSLKLWQVDAFADQPFAGNPASVVLAESWLADAAMQAIAAENNQSETAFLVRQGEGLYGLRWFTPTVEVPLCGHATLAAGWVILNHVDPALRRADFQTKSGALGVERAEGERYRMRLPAARVSAFAAPDGFEDALGRAMEIGRPSEVHYAPKGAAGMPGLLAVWTEAEIGSMRLTADLAPLLGRIGCGALLATARASGPRDFVSRFFAPVLGVPEDPVTGSMHCALTPFWANRLGKTVLSARQMSARGGDILCTDEGDRVALTGRCALYMTGEIAI